MSIVLISAVPDTPWTYATLDALKRQLGILDTAQDDALSDLLTQASALVDAYCGRSLAYAEWSETFRLGPHSTRSCLILARLPVVSISGLTVDDTDLIQMVDALDFDGDAGLLYPLPGSSAWGCGYGTRRITVTYAAGYVLQDIPQRDGTNLLANLPAEITAATLIAARSLYFAPRRGDPMLRSESAQGVGSVSYLDPDTATGALPPDAAAALANYRRAGIA